MKFSAATALLLASTALAFPSPEAVQKMTERRHERMAKRLAMGGRRTKGNFPINKVNATADDSAAQFGPTEYVSYDSNWAGVVKNDNSITQVVGTFNNPTVKAPSGSKSGTQYGAAYWVGIDGDSCQSAILQTGVSGVIENGQAQYAAWYEWYPNYSYTFSGFQVSPGDSITASVIATSAVSGTATIKNLRSGKSVTHTFRNQGQYGSLCQQNAEWIVEDFESGNNLIAFANFGTVTFTSSSYKAGGTTKSISGGSVLDVKQGSTRYTQTTVNSGSGLTIKYVGP